MPDHSTKAIHSNIAIKPKEYSVRNLHRELLHLLGHIDLITKPPPFKCPRGYRHDVIPVLLNLLPLQRW
jgi:hypothetical protein